MTRSTRLRFYLLNRSILSDVSILSKRTRRDFAGRKSKAASMNGSTNSDPLAFHRHQQHSIYFLSAVSAPRRKMDFACLVVSPSDRNSSASTKSVPRAAIMRGCDLGATLRIGFLDAADFFFDILEARFIQSPRPHGSYGAMLSLLIPRNGHSTARLKNPCLHSV